MAQTARASAPAASAQMPSPSLLANFRLELAVHAPFAQMEPGAVDFFLAHCEQHYYAAGDVLVQPRDGVVQQIYYIRQGAVTGVRGLADLSGGAFEYEAGALFPLSAAVAQRAVTATYTAAADTFVLALPCTAVMTLAQLSPTFADFLNRRIATLLELSRRALQIAYSSQTLAEQSLETPLGELVSGRLITCGPESSLRDALLQMQQSRVGSMLVVDTQSRPVGIFTRYDVLGRVALAETGLDTPMREVMVHPVHSLTTEDTAHDAALLMSRHTVRHVPVTQDGVAVGLVSERDLFAMQRLSLKQVGTSIRAASNIDTLKMVSQDIRRFARNLLSQGVQARQLTSLISHLNDVLTQRLLELKATEHGIDLAPLCWLALGSEGRSEQTIATDQDNALILPDGTGDSQRRAILAFAHDVNLALDACGYPLCRGGVMAGEPSCCLTVREWRERFSHWIEHGAPQDVVNASIYFDLRPLAGYEQVALDLKAEVFEAARRTPRFLKQLAQNALSHDAPLNWLGGIDVDERGTLDLKLQGTAIFVDTARLYSLARGTVLTSTRERLESAGTLMGLAPSEYQGWAGGFEFLQMLRLRVQLEDRDAARLAEPNRLAIASLNEIDRRILKESLRVARSLQQRLRLDYER
jgi:CBS domain-containing protein